MHANENNNRCKCAFDRFFLTGAMLLVLLWLLLPGTLAAQTYLNAVGSPTFTTAEPVELGFINVANGNLHIEIPLESLSQRGSLQRGAKLVYDSRIWNIVFSTWQPTNVLDSQGTNLGGWRFLNPAETGKVAWITTGNTCNDVPPYGVITDYGGFSWTDPNGTVHWFSNVSTERVATRCIPTYGPGTPDSAAFADDSTGLYMTVHNYTSATVYAKDGTQVFPALTDTNGNYFSKDANGNPIDTLGRTVVTKTANGSTTTYAVTNSQGTTSNFVVTTGTITANTNFGQSGVTECSTNCTFIAITRIDLPVSGMSYVFTYDSGTALGNFGLIKSITLPTGGIINYGFTTFADSYNDRNRWLNTRTSGGGTWTYTPAVVTSCGPGTVGCQQTVTVKKPSNDNVVYTFTLNNGAWKAQSAHYNGAVAPANLLTTLMVDYDFSNACLPNSCTGARYITTTRNTTSITSAGGATLTRKTEYSYDNPTYANIAEVRDWKYYTGTAPSTPDFKTDITYLANAAYANVGIINRPLTSIKSTGTGTWISQTNYVYDTGSLSTAGATGIVHHDDTGFGSTNTVRGNPTKVDKLLSSGATCPSSNCLETVLSYDITGQPVSVQDPAGNSTTYSFSDNFFSDNGSNPPLPYTPAQATNAYLTKVTRPLSLTTKYGYYFGSGKGAFTTDPASNTRYVHYLDLLDRVTQKVDELGNVTNIQHPGGTQVESVLSINGSSAEDTLLTLDSLGRISTAQTKQAPGSTNFDTVSESYDTNGRSASITMPCVVTVIGQPCPSTPATSIQYDGLDRQSSVTDGGGGTASYIYTGNDVKQTVGPAPTGENTRSRQTEYDGLGRLTSVCEILASGGSACGQTGSASGYKTSYAYSIPAAGTSQIGVTQGVQTRTYKYDSLGRLTSETNPESGVTSYVHDTDTVYCTSSTSKGDLASKTDANGNKTCYVYDQLHRITDVIPYKNGVCSPPVKRFRYDSTANAILLLPSGYSTAPNASGRMIEAWDGDCTWPIPTNGSTTGVDEWFAYSARGEMTDLWASSPQIAGYYHGKATYAANGALSSLGGVPGYTTITYGLDGEGRLNSATQGSTSLASSTTYNAASQPRVIDIGNSGGDTDNYAYDPNTGRMTNWTFTVGSTPKSQTGTLTWNPNGTLQQLVIGDGFNTGSTGGSQTCKFGDPSASVPGYDDLGRVVRADCGSAWLQTFSFDQYGNISKSGSSSWTPGYDPTTNHAVPPITYDSNGNLLYDTIHHYAWYVDNKLASTDSTTCTIFGSTNGTCILYDAFGREVERGVNGSYTEVMYTPVGKTAIMNGQFTTVSASFPLPGGATYFQTGSANGSGYFWHKDWLGSVRLSSSVLNRTYYFDRAFAPYGEMYKNFGNSGGLNFTGDTQDSFAGLLYDTPNRELHPGQGRWISPDPAGLSAADFSNPQTWNRYAYVNNNPLAAIDPLGLIDCHVEDCGGPTSAYCGGWCDGGFDILGGTDFWNGNEGSCGMNVLNCSDLGPYGSGARNPSGFNFGFGFSSDICNSDFMPCGLPMPSWQQSLWSDVLGLPTLPCSTSLGPWCNGQPMNCLPICDAIGHVSPLMDPEQLALEYAASAPCLGLSSCLSECRWEYLSCQLREGPAGIECLLLGTMPSRYGGESCGPSFGADVCLHNEGWCQFGCQSQCAGLYPPVISPPPVGPPHRF